MKAVCSYCRNGFLFATMLVIASSSVLWSQDKHPSAPSFMAATIRPVDPNRPDRTSEIAYDDDSGVFTVENMSLKLIMKFAYDLRLSAEQQISGSSNCTSSSEFNVIAKPDSATAIGMQKLTEDERDILEQKMVQALLADRFNLKVHHETRILPTYQLIAVKSGSKLKPLNIPAGSPEDDETTVSRGKVKCRRCSIDDLVGTLIAQPEIGGRLILDKTQLTGNYDFVLKWTPDPTAGEAPPSGDSGVRYDPSAPSLFTAVQEQLGLKLSPTKGPVDVIVIDHVEMPSPN